MRIPHEKSMSAMSRGVYPKHRKPIPSSLCCFRIMHIRTGAMWIAYGEMMWVTTQLAFWAAESVIKYPLPLIWIIIGYISTFLQIFFIIALVRGVRNYDANLVMLYIFSLFIQIFVYIVILVAFLVANLLEDLDEDSFLRRLFLLKMLFCICHILVKFYAIDVAYRCYKFIACTEKFCRTAASFEEGTTIITHK